MKIMLPIFGVLLIRSMTWLMTADLDSIPETGKLSAAWRTSVHLRLVLPPGRE